MVTAPIAPLRTVYVVTVRFHRTGNIVSYRCATATERAITEIMLSPYADVVNERLESTTEDA